MTPAIPLGFVAGGATLIGAYAVARKARAGLEVIELFVCFSAGFMIALAIGGAIPESFARNPGTAAPVILLGYLLVHLSQHTFTRHFHFGEETHAVSPETSRSAIAGLALHTFFDGVAIASGFLVSPALGMLFFVGIALHKLPEGVAIASLVLASGGTVRGSYIAAAFMGVATVLGVLLTDMSHLLSDYGLPLSAGVTLYVGASNLVPEFQHRRGWKPALAFFAGAGVFMAAHALLGRVVV